MLYTFMCSMDYILREYFGKHVVMHFDDILIYSKTLHEHVKHVKWFFITFRKDKLYANFNNGRFCMEKVNFLGFIVGKME